MNDTIEKRVKIPQGEVVILISRKTRIIKISFKGISSLFNMDDDPYPLKGPLYNYISTICNNNKYSMTKIRYPINMHRGFWERHWLF